MSSVAYSKGNRLHIDCTHPGTAGPWPGLESCRTPSTRAARPQPDAHDDGHLQPRDAGAGQRAADRMSVLLMTGVVAPTATRNESGRSPEGERPDRRGGAEGTRTPDPHTASVVR